MKPLLLASSSIYRKKLLDKLHLEFSTDSPNIDEQCLAAENPKSLALRLGKEKAIALQNKYPDHLIIGSDQVATFSNQILGKPNNYQNTIDQLRMQSGKSVKFHTSICVLDSSSKQLHCDVDTSTVYFKKLSEQQIVNYVTLEKPYDCAGGFKSESLGIALFNKIEAEDPNSLIGLPLIKLIGLLEKFDINVI